MEDTQSDARMTTETAVEQLVDEAQGQQSSAGPVSRMLANPRRVRRA
ncbi:hypothetical protein [Blastococcus sp. TF02A-26]|nr:hypothetical protein [Blastococcus sp. TF02A-26]